MVHGIGNQEEGAHCDAVSTAIVAALNSGGMSQATLLPELDPDFQDHRRFSVTTTNTAGKQTTREVIFGEGYWAKNTFTRASATKALRWLLISLPALMLLFAPDQRDRVALTDPDSVTPPGGSLPEQKEYRREAMASVARFSRRIFLLLVVVALALQAPSHVRWWILLLAVFGGVLVVLRSGLIQDVQMAVSDDGEIEKVLTRLTLDLDRLTDRVDSVIVIGHSQGGFLSYELLNRPRPRRGRRVPIAFVGAASGLKPIWLMRQLRLPQLRTAAWLLFLAETVAAVSILLPGYQPKTPLLIQYMRENFWQEVQTLGQPIAATNPVTFEQPLEQMQKLRQALAESQLPFTKVSLIIFVFTGALCWWVSRLLKVVKEGNLVRLPSFVSPPPRPWWEISSHHDPVGRLLLPMLPQASERLSWPITGNGLLDHVHIQRRGSLFAEELAAFLIEAQPGHDLSTGKPLDVVAARCADIAYRMTRIRRVHAWALMLLIAYLIFYHTQRSLSLDTVVPDHVLLLATALAILGLSNLVCSVFVRAKGVRALELDRSSAHKCPEPRPLSMRHRYVGGLLLGAASLVAFMLMAYFSTLQVHFPVFHQFAVGMAMMWTGFTVTSVLFVAGYLVTPFFPLFLISSGMVMYRTVPAFPHQAALPMIWALPGVMGLGIIMFLSTGGFFVLRHGRRTCAIRSDG